MPLSDEQIFDSDALIAPNVLIGLPMYAYGQLVRAIESAVTAPLLAQIAALEAQLAEARNQRDEAWETLAEIGDFAHDRSTGPAVPDALWEIRSMAYTAVKPAIDSAIAQELPATQPAQQDELRHLWDGSPWPNYVVTLEENTEAQGRR